VEVLDTFSALYISEESFADFSDHADSEWSKEHCEPQEHPLYRGNSTFGQEKFKV